MRLPIPSTPSSSSWPLAVVCLALAACASAGGSAAQPCVIDADCVDASLICVYTPSDAVEGNCEPRPDAGARRDAGLRADGGRTDGGRGDGGARLDGGGDEDGGPSLDGGPELDGGPAFDGGPVFDGGARFDGGQAFDGGARVDGGAQFDGGQLQDGGAAQDGGPADGGVAPLSEIEPNDALAAPQDLTTRALPWTLAGSLSSGDDLDFYAVRWTRGTLVRVTLAGASLDAVVIVAGADDANFHFVRAVAMPSTGATATRQVFIPYTGLYVVVVRDRTGDGAGGDYSLRVAAEPVPTPTAAVVGTPQTGTLADGAIRFYSVTPSAGPISATAAAATLSPASELDTLLTIWDPSSQTVIAEVDDGDTWTGTRAFTTDARVSWQAAGGKGYQVLVDHAVLGVATNNYRLDLASVAAEGATESNDRFSTAYPLTVAQAAYTGSMRSTTATDWDVYSVYLGATEGVTVTATGNVGAAGREHWTFFQVVDASGTPRRFGVGDGAFNATSKFYPGLAGTYYIFVTDLRYLQPGTAVGERPEDASGTQYRIDLTTDTAPLVEVRASPQTGTVSTRGASRYYRVNHTGGVLLVKATGSTADFVPGVNVWEPSGLAPGRPRTLFAGVNSDVVAVGLNAGEYIVEVNELFGYTGTFTVTWQSLNVSAAANTFVGESDTNTSSTTNNTCATANNIGGVPGVAMADLAAGDIDYFKFTATSTSAVVRTAGAGFDTVDTTIAVQRTDGSQVATNADENAAQNQYYSRVQATVVAGQTYCVRVTGATATDSGAYALIVTPN